MPLPANSLVLLSSLLVGLGIAMLARWLVAMADSPRDDQRLTPTEAQRRKLLRARSATYRWFEPLIDDLAAWNQQSFPHRAEVLQHDLELIQPEAPWRAGEFMGTKQLEGVMLFAAGMLLGYVLVGIELAAFVAVLAYVVGLFVMFRSVTQQAKKRLARLRSRLPFTVDLMALMLESGSIFRECLEKSAEENRGHPLGDELQLVCAGLRRGSSQADALRELARRLDDGDINELVFSINTAEERGGKLRDTLRDMAEQIRSRRIHWLERAAEEAKVRITWPGMVIMVACLLIIAAPLLLQGMGK